MSGTNKTLADRVDDDAISTIVFIGSIIFLFLFGAVIFFAFGAASEDREKEITIACINSGGTWTEGIDDNPASCTRP